MPLAASLGQFDLTLAFGETRSSFSRDGVRATGACHPSLIRRVGGVFFRQRGIAVHTYLVLTRHETGFYGDPLVKDVAVT